MGALIVDIEATCWDNDQRKQNTEAEIIEIGAVKISGEEFDAFVKPILNPELSEFCRKLTKIEQGQVDKAETFDKVIANFKEFVGDNIVWSWGNYDRRKILADCNYWKVPFDFRHFNLKHYYAKVRGVKQCGVRAALELEKLAFVGELHRGIDDARNIARIFKILVEESHIDSKTYLPTKSF